MQQIDIALDTLLSRYSFISVFIIQSTDHYCYLAGRHSVDGQNENAYASIPGSAQDIRGYLEMNGFLSLENEKNLDKVTNVVYKNNIGEYLSPFDLKTMDFAQCATNT